LVSIVRAIAVHAVSVGRFAKGSCMCVAVFSRRKNGIAIMIVITTPHSPAISASASARNVRNT